MKKIILSILIISIIFSLYSFNGFSEEEDRLEEEVEIEIINVDIQDLDEILTTEEEDEENINKENTINKEEEIIQEEFEELEESEEEEVIEIENLEEEIEDKDNYEIIEDEEIPLAEKPSLIVYIYSDKRAVMFEGETVHIYSELINSEYYNITTYNWYYTTDNINWNIIPDAHESIYSFSATAESLSYGYKLIVYYQ